GLWHDPGTVAQRYRGGRGYHRANFGSPPASAYPRWGPPGHPGPHPGARKSAGPVAPVLDLPVRALIVHSQARHLAVARRAEGCHRWEKEKKTAPFRPGGVDPA